MNNSRKRKMLLILPLLVIPFLTLAFWAMGGGKANDQPITDERGLNLHLPEANLKEDKMLDKLGFYDKAARDSMKMQEWMRSDPYYKDTANTKSFEISHNNPEQKIMQRIEQLQYEMSKPTADKDPVEEKNVSPDFLNEMDRLENMMLMMNKTESEDPEIKQLEGTLDKILDIQHPERIKERSKERTFENKKQVFPVSKQSTEDTLAKGFYGLSNEEVNIGQNAIEAVVHENQTMVNGAIIKLRLLNDMYINGQKIPKDNFVFGIVSLNEERLNIEIHSIRSHNNLYTVKLEVYDMDGLPGIYIPGAITRDVAKQSTDNSLQLMEMTSLDPSFRTQATTAGISAAKNLLSKKVKLVKVLVKAGYKILLKDKNNQL